MSNPYANHYEDDYVQPPYQNMHQNKSQGPLDHLKDGLEGQARTAFIAKVYALLSIQLLVTFTFCLIAQFSQGYRSFQLDYWWVIIIPVVLIITVAIVACCVQKSRRPPLDTILLAIFVLSFSYIVSFCCSAVVDGIDQPVVPIAIAATIAISVALTAYAFLCKGNWKVMMGVLVVCVAVSFTLAISLFFTRMPILVILICALGVIIYGIYLVFVTKMIIGGQIPGFPMDAPIFASLLLYLYIMRIFLYILTILGIARR